MSNTLTYSLLRYRHSYLLQEEVNVGVLLYFHKDEQLRFLFPNSLQRISGLYPDFSTSLIKHYLKSFHETARKLENDFQKEPSPLIERDLKSIINNAFLVRDATALYFTEPQLGSYKNVEKTIRYYWDTYLSFYSKEEKRSVKNEDYLIHRFEEEVQKYELDASQQIEKNVTIESDLITEIFPYGWQNGTKNLVTPIGLDLSSDHRLEKKALLWQAKLHTISIIEEIENYRFDLIISRPQQRELFSNYDRALKILDESGAPQKLVEEDEFAAYVEQIAV